MLGHGAATEAMYVYSCVSVMRPRDAKSKIIQDNLPRTRIFRYVWRNYFFRTIAYIVVEMSGLFIL